MRIGEDSFVTVTVNRATAVCECGCGQPVPSPRRGGYNRVLRRDAWFASNTCCARFENAILALKNDGVDLRHGDIAALLATQLQGRTR